MGARPQPERLDEHATLEWHMRVALMFVRFLALDGKVAMTTARLASLWDPIVDRTCDYVSHQVRADWSASFKTFVLR